MTPRFVGRVQALSNAHELVDSHDPAAGVIAVYAIDGMAGVGKTEFVLRIAHSVADRYPDGVFFLDLTAHTPNLEPMTVMEALRSLLVMVGVEEKDIPGDLGARQSLWQRSAARLRMLLVLDNAADRAQVEPLLPGGPGCLVLITSRRKLIDLPRTVPFALGLFSVDEARQLLETIAGQEQCADASSVHQVIELCGRLPLALQIAASMLVHRSGYDMGLLAHDLAEERRHIDDLVAGDDSLHAAVHASINLSYRSLPVALKRAFRLCGFHPGQEIIPPALAALFFLHDGEECAVRITASRIAQVQRMLLGLVDRNLLQLQSTTEFGPRYRQHDLVRASARMSCLQDESDDNRRHALNHLCLAYLATLEHAESWSFGGSLPSGSAMGSDHDTLWTFSDLQVARRWVDLERENLLACVGSAPRAAGPLAQMLAPQLRDLGHLAAARQSYQVAHEWHAEWEFWPYSAHALRGLASVAEMTGDYDLARHYFRDAQKISRATDDILGQVRALTSLASLKRLTDDNDGARAQLHEALEVFEAAEESFRMNPIMQRGLAMALRELGLVEQAEEDLPAALETFNQAQQVYARIGDPVGRADVLWSMADIERTSGYYELAKRHFGELLEWSRGIHDPHRESQALWGLGQVEKSTGNPSAAVEILRQAVDIDRRTGGQLPLARGLIGLADAERLDGDREDARRHFAEAHAMCVALKDQAGVAEVLTGYGDIAWDEGDLARARELWAQAVTIYQEINHPGAARIGARLH